MRFAIRRVSRRGGACLQTKGFNRTAAISGLSGYRLQSVSRALFQPFGLKGNLKIVVFLILESLGSTELLFILVMALLFFGPRKLPQLSRSLGKSMAEFRKASDDFKRTWEREVSFEESNSSTNSNPATLSNENSIFNDETVGRSLQQPTIEPVAADQVIPRQPSEIDTSQSSDSSDFADDAQPPRKRDWL